MQHKILSIILSSYRDKVLSGRVLSIATAKKKIVEFKSVYEDSCIST